MTSDRPKSTGRKAFERRWRLAQAEAKRPKAGCALACVACALLTASVVNAAAFFMAPTPAAAPSTTTLPRVLP